MSKPSLLLLIYNISCSDAIQCIPSDNQSTPWAAERAQNVRACADEPPSPDLVGPKGFRRKKNDMKKKTE